MAPTFARSRGVFSSLGVKNYRRFWAGQAGSLVGTWMQITAMSWLVLRVTGSSSAVGLVVGLQKAPLLLLGPYAGVVVDRVDKRKLVLALQSVMCVQAAVLAWLTLSGRVEAWHLFALALLLGACDAFELPARHVMVRELVGDDLLVNAQGLSSVTANAASLVGPAVGGVVIAVVGEGWCFVFNAVSFLGLFVALLTLDQRAIVPSPRAARARGQLREGLRYAARTPAIAVPLLMTALACVLAFQITVVLPAVSEQVWDSGSRGYGLMLAAGSAGAVIGGLYIASRRDCGLVGLTVASGAAGVMMLVVALAPTLEVQLLALVLEGCATISFFVIAGTTVQLAAPAQMRARMSALTSVAVGMGALGAPLLGWIVTQVGPRGALLVGATTFLVVAAIGRLGWRRCYADAVVRQSEGDTVTPSAVS